MKKILIFLLVCLSANTQCMEQPQQRERKIEENELGSFGNWPEVLIEYLFYFIPEASSIKEIFKKLAQLSLINSKFKEIVESKVLLKELGKRYIKFHRLGAEKQFLDASDQILRGNRTKEYDTIIATLLPGINFTLKNKILIDASKKGNIEIVKLVLNSGSIDDFYANVALMYASKKGTIEIVQLLLDKDADVNAISDDGGTALMLASKKGNREIIELLLNSGADINAISNNGNIALIMAAESGHREIVEVLLNNGASNGSTNKAGSTALIVAAMNGHKEVIKLLLDNNADINAKDQYRCTALTYASRNGDKEIVKLLLDFGADGHAPIRKLIKAALLGKKEKGKRVLEKWVGINENDSIISNFIEEKRLLTSIPEAKSVQDIFKRLENLSQLDSRLETCIEDEVLMADLAKEYCRLHSQQAENELIDSIKQITSGPAVPLAYDTTLAKQSFHLKMYSIIAFLAYGMPFFNNNLVAVALVHAAKENHRQVVRKLLEKGADVNAKTIYGDTALMAACSNGFKEIVQLLLDHGADVNPIDRSGNLKSTPLIEASINGNKEIVELLIKNEANVNTADSPGRTALRMASCYGHLEVVELLLGKGADINARDRLGATALMMASKFNDKKLLAKLLIDEGAHVNLASYDGSTALTKAAEYGRNEVVKLLLGAGADINARDNHGYTALSIASRHGHKEVVEILLDFGADVNVATKGGFTALYSAANNGYQEIVELLLNGGADITATTFYGDTALSTAIFHKHTSTIALLKSYQSSLGPPKTPSCCMQ